jgi:general secretion pathway protein H
MAATVPQADREKMKTSPAAPARAHRGGYTLIELTVVLAIIALIVALVAPRLFMPSSSGEIRRAASLIETASRMARADARMSGRDALVIVDLQAHTVEVVPRGQVRALPPSVGIEARVAEAELTGARAAIRFLPDGGATGGRFELEHGDMRGSVNVDWITGKVAHAPPQRTE